ncbi:MAG: GNAT family N-acetyltransferase [Pseudomonadota bacterium]
MRYVHFIEGPVGAGKTTYARLLGQKLQAPPLVLDTWMATLFRPDRPDGDFWRWYSERKARCIDQMWQVAQDALEFNDHVVLELGLLTSAARDQMARRAKDAGAFNYWHILELSEDVRWQRIEDRNKSKTPSHVMDVSRELFEMVSALWEPVDNNQLVGRVIYVQDSKTVPDLHVTLRFTGPRALLHTELDQAADLCLRSKAHWGYGDAFLNTCRASLTITQTELMRDRIVVVTNKSHLAALAHVLWQTDECHLDKLFVDPDHMGLGLGRRLFHWAVKTARELNARALIIVSDPGAVEFYRSLGCDVIGSVLSEVDANRKLPKLLYEL